MNNPLPEILELIPQKQIVLDLLLADSMRGIIAKITGNIVNNSYVVLLLNHLAQSNFIEIKELTFPDIEGSTILLRKKINGY
jgi:hypothetical protein